MEPSILDLRLHLGADFAETYEVPYASGEFVDWTGYTFKAWVVSSTSDVAAAAVVTASAAGTLLTLSIAKSVVSSLTASRTYVWDLFATSPGGQTFKIFVGRVTVVARGTK
jgi:hypothetical protein